MQVAAIPSDPKVREKVIGILKQRFGDQFTTADAIRERHGKGESYHDTAAPDGVFFPNTTEEVADEQDDSDDGQLMSRMTELMSYPSTNK